MIRLFSAHVFSIITLMVIGWNNVVFAQTLNNYCAPAPVKENVSIEKIQIGSWASTSLAIAQPKNTVEASLFAGGAQNYELSVQGIPQTRDTFYWQIWVDLNQDMDFEDKGENLLQVATPRKQKATGKILMPSGFSGQLAMRAMLSKAKANNPCGSRSKVLGYYDFWLLGNCPEVDAVTQLRVDKIFKEQIILRFNWPGNTHFQWRLKGLEETSWTQIAAANGDSLLLDQLKDFNVYSFQYRLQCEDSTWSNWSDTIDLETAYKPVCRAIKLTEVTLDSTGVNYAYLTVLPQDNSDRFEYSLISYEGKGDTVIGFSPYGQFKATVNLAEALYFFKIKKHCLNGGISEWTAAEEFAVRTLKNPCPNVELKINKIGTKPYSAKATPAKKTAYEWRWRIAGQASWNSQVTPADSLPLAHLDTIHAYELQVRVECVPGFWTDWSLGTQVTLDQSCPRPSLDSLTVKVTGRIEVEYTGKAYKGVKWDFTPRNKEECKYEFYAYVQRITFHTNRGERLYVRMKGICPSNVESIFSDSLWLEQPCEPIDSKSLSFIDITDTSVIPSISNADLCDKHEYLVSRDSLLPEQLWQRYPKEITGLLPNTKYFIKVRRLCVGEKPYVTSSFIRSFTTLAAPLNCATMDSSHFDLAFRPPYGVAIIIKPEFRNAVYQYYVEGLDEHLGGYSLVRFRDSVLFWPVCADTKYRIQLKRICSETVQSDWTIGKIFSAPEMPCPKLNGSKIKPDFNNLDGTVIYNENQAGKFAPYLWRFRVTNSSKWDTLASDNEKVKLPIKNFGKYHEVQIKPMNPAGCTDNWSNSKWIPTSCPSITIQSKKVSGTSVEIICSPVDSIFEWRYAPEGAQQVTTIFTGNRLMLSNLKPNTNYSLFVRTKCYEEDFNNYVYTTFTTKSCYFDSLKIAHEFRYPDQLFLKTNLPYSHKSHRTAQYEWKVSPHLDFLRYNANKDTITFLKAKPGVNYQISLKYTCDIYSPEQTKTVYHQINLLPCAVPDPKRIVISNIGTHSMIVGAIPEQGSTPYLGLRKKGSTKFTGSYNLIWGLVFSNLEPNTTYELALKEPCELNLTSFTSWSEIITVTTLKENGVGTGQLAETPVALQQVSQQLRLVPNPTQGQFNLELPEPIEGPAELSITNLNGQRIYNAQVQISPGTAFPLDLSRQPQGVYLVHVRVGNQLYQEKLVLIK